MQINRPSQIAIFFISLVVILAGNHLLPLLDWDEANFGEIAREMVISGNYLEPQVAYEPFYEKPPLFFWLQSISMHFFGIHEFSARLPVALFGALTLLLIYRIGARETGHYFGIVWAIMYAGSLHFLYFKLGLIDPIFNYFIILSVYYLYKQEKLLQEKQNARREALILGLLAGIAVLLKGPVAILIIGIIWLLRLMLSNVSAKKVIGLSLLSLFGGFFIISLWIIPLMAAGKTAFFEAFFLYQLDLAGGQIEWHNQPWYYHLIALLIVCFPASILCWPYLFKRYARAQANWDFYMSAVFWVVLIVFSFVTTKIVHYSSLCWYPITYFAAQLSYQQFTSKQIGKKRYMGWGIIFIGGILGFISLAIPIIMNSGELKTQIILQIKDAFAVDQISTNTEWPVYFALIGGILLAGSLVLSILQFRRKGTSVWFWLLLLTFLFAQAVYFLLLPKVTEHTQNRFIKKAEEIDKSGGLQYNLDFRTYALLFYGQFKPKDKKIVLKNGEVFTFKMPEKNMMNWATETSSKKINKDFYLWVKRKDINLDSNWLKKETYSGYTLYVKEATKR